MRAKITTTGTPPLVAVIPLYPGFDMLDVCGPLVFFHTAGMQVILAAAVPGPVTALQGVALQAVPFSAVPAKPDVLWVPGGAGDGYDAQFDHKNPLLAWLAKIAPSTRYVCSVCTGAHIAAAAGLLKGYTVTTHWLFRQPLTLFPDIQLAPGFPRYWIDRNRVTGGGISSGLDESLAVIGMLYGDEMAKSVQLLNQYAPVPPYNSGTPDVASPALLGNFFLPSNYGMATGSVSDTISKFLKS